MFFNVFSSKVIVCNGECRAYGAWNIGVAFPTVTPRGGSTVG